MKTHFYLESIIDICNLKHLSAEDIYNELRKNYPKVAKASVYRNIDKLVKMGKLNEVITTSKKSYYEKTIKPHIHLVDQDGKIEDINLDISKLDIKVPKGFKTKKINITIYGER